jgi:hypothetical protein
MQRSVKKHFDLAAKVAVKPDDCRTYRLGCIGYRSDGAMVQSPNGPTPVPMREMHAELRVSRKLDYGATVYVVRVLRDGSFGKAMPCAPCLKALKSKKVKKVYFTISSEDYGVIKFC